MVTVALLGVPRLFAQSGQVYRVAFLSGGRQSDTANAFSAFLEGLRTPGYGQGRNLELDAR